MTVIFTGRLDSAGSVYRTFDCMSACKNSTRKEISSDKEVRIACVEVQRLVNAQSVIFTGTAAQGNSRSWIDSVLSFGTPVSFPGPDLL
ncbi:hypothetical protein BaRGS_00032002 [Batillaria attramentaria]|uniref:Uncharacterized protein n=1 Tax=Batillaria attramentaria TaxID=370345 RepID=A0ABD0JQ31_9CAEN